MKPLFHAFLLAGALLSSGVPQAAATIGEDGCCPEDESVPCPDVPLGVACACCPSSSAVHGSGPDVARAASPVVAVAIVIPEPSLDASVAEIFQPPRR